MKNPSKKWQTYLVAALFTLALWVYVGLQNPESELPYKNIPISIELSERQAEAGLAVVSGKNQRMEIVVVGKRSILNNIDASEIKAWVEDNTIVEAGEYELPVQVSLPVSDVIISRRTPSTIKIRIDRIVSRNIPVRVEVSNSLGSLYTVEAENYTPDQILVSGPETEIDQIREAVVRVHVDKTGSYQEFSVVPELRDLQGEPADLTDLTVDTTEVQVGVRVIRSKTVPLKVEFINNVSGWGSDLIKYELSVKSVAVSGADDVIGSLESISVEKVDLSSIAKNADMTLAILYPEGVTPVTPVYSVNLHVEISGMLTKIFEIGEFELINVPSGYTAEVLTDFVDVQVRGPEKDVTSVEQDDITVRVNMAVTDSKPGTYEVEAEVVLPEEYKVAALGDVKVLVRLTREEVQAPDDQNWVTDPNTTPSPGWWIGTPTPTPVPGWSGRSTR